MGLNLRREKYKVIESKTTGETLEICAAPLGARDGRRVLGMLAEMLSPALIPLIGQTGNSVNALANDPRVGAALVRSVQNISEHEDKIDIMVNLFKDRSGFKPEGKEWVFFNLPDRDVNSFDNVFAGALDLQLKWLLFNLEVNFSSFLGSIQSASPVVEQPLNQ